LIHRGPPDPGTDRGKSPPGRPPARMNMGTTLAQLLGTIGSLRSSRLLRDTVSTTGLSVLGKGIGFAIPFFVAAWFGIDFRTDAFFFTYGLVLLLAGIFFPVVEAVIVPFITEIKSQSESEVRRFVGTALVLSIAGLAVLGAVFLLVSRPVLSVVTKFPQESLDLIFHLFLETSPLLLLLVSTSLLSGVLNAYRLFALPAVSPGIRASVAILTIFALKGEIGVHSIAVGYVFGELARFTALFIYAAKKGIAPTVTSVRADGRVYEFLRTASYQVTGMAIIVFNPVVDKTMASWLGLGSVSLLEYSYRLYEIPLTFIARGFFVVLLSHWSASFYEEGRPRPSRISDLKRSVFRTAWIVGGGGVVASVILILLREPLVSLVYGRGEFDVEHLSIVYTVWTFYLIGLGPTVFGWVFARAHLVLKNTKLLMFSGIVNAVLNVALNLALIGPLGLNGLALSTAITHTVVTVVLVVFFLRKTS